MLGMTNLKTHCACRGFTRSVMDSYLFILKKNCDVIWALIYVDDIIVTGSNQSYIVQFIKRLDKEFSLKDLGPISFFLGLEAIRCCTALYLNQRKYVCDLLARTYMTNCKINPTPESLTLCLSKNVGTRLYDYFMYRSTVGSLQLSF